MALSFDGLIPLAFAFVAGSGGTLLLARAAGALRILDHPRGRQVHARPRPLVGGLAIFIAFLGAAAFVGITHSAGYFLFALSIVIAVGLWDDVAEISPRVKLLIQIIASSLMIWGAGVELNSVGNLLGWHPIGLSFLAVPLTIFAI